MNSEISDIDGMGYLTLSYANGPSAQPRQEIKQIPMSTLNKFVINWFLFKFLVSFLDQTDYRYPSLVPMNYETHGGEDVAIYARGPFSHLFSGVLEQNTIPHFTVYASGIGDGLTACNKRN